MTWDLTPEPLSRAAFAAFGEVIDEDGPERFPINQGTTIRHHALAHVETAGEGAEAIISLFVATPLALPLEVRVMERHPLGSQAFMPLDGLPFLVVVAADPDDPSSYRAFRASPRQGVNYRRQVWHHPVIALERASRFLVVDRAGPGDNLEEVHLAPGQGPRVLPA